LIRRWAVAGMRGVFGAAVLVSLGLVLVNCEHRARGPGVAADTTSGPVPRQVSYDAVFRLTRGDRPRSTMHAERMEQYETEDSTYTLLESPSETRRVQVYVFDATGDSSATITADRVYVYNRENRFEAYGNVIVETQDDRTLWSEHLTWNEADRKIRTRRFVRIRTPTERVQGTGLVADEDLDTYSIGRFTAQVEVDDETESPEPDGPTPSPDTSRSGDVE
jgi:LPS export ABC transporter protein LptC